MADETSGNPWSMAASEPAADNPWGATESTSATSQDNPWGAADGAAAGGDGETTAGDWLAGGEIDVAEAGLDLIHPFQEAVIPLGTWVDQGLEWAVDNLRGVFQAIRWPIDATLTGIESALLAVPDILMQYQMTDMTVTGMEAPHGPQTGRDDDYRQEKHEMARFRTHHSSISQRYGRSEYCVPPRHSHQEHHYGANPLTSRHSGSLGGIPLRSDHPGSLQESPLRRRRHHPALHHFRFQYMPRLG